MFNKVFLLIILLVSTTLLPHPTQATPIEKRNVIFMIMDGTNQTATTLARWYKEEPLVLDEMATGLVRTYSKPSIVTDSAAAGTALSTGMKTFKDYVGIVPGGEAATGDGKPVATIMEAAKLEGYRTGLVVTAPVQHATPATFSSHVMNRNQFQDIAKQQVYLGMDVVMGGGVESLVPTQNSEKRNSQGADKELKSIPMLPKNTGRTDGENLLEVIRNKGYSLVQTKQELAQVRSAHIWGAFSTDDMLYDFDRIATHSDQPSLAQMTEKALNVLEETSEKGFFLLVEGSKVDWAAHQNDPIGIVSEVLAFDEAVGRALNFAKTHQNTELVVVTDHGNSGLTIGNEETNKTYATTKFNQVIDPLKKATHTVEGAVSLLNQRHSNVKEVAEAYGLDGLSDEEFDQLKTAAYEGDTAMKNALTTLLAKRAHLGFTTHGHTGEDVVLYAYGGDGNWSGTWDNTDLPKKMAKYLGVSLEGTTRALFVDANAWLSDHGYNTHLADTNGENIVLVASKRGLPTLRFPANKNIVLIGENQVELPGVTVFINGRFYLPNEGLPRQ